VEVTNIDDVVRAFLSFLREDGTLAARFSWRPYAV
jgi:hypothetical protein